ncbi:MAG: T9SS type A sorting domain-containing protein [Altibacter sp.]|uniref:T9SS type A sorting domain-containing protein n=1 Tax=Altibacter sp. TaxID=2024823 RepID=UPI001D759436|nr:T9SS type A sorting domain-containing protein [Altibacter sp.]MBZ0328147.1 T9SS type A sorting domain-containing protein [Altibacter sp.]
MKKITLMAVLFVSGLTLQAQTSFTGNTSGDPVYNTPASERQVVLITHSNTQTINPGDEIACASPTSFRDNSIFRDFDLAVDFGIAGAFEVTSAEIAIGPVTSPAGFPLTVNVYSMTDPFPGSWPGSAVLEGTAGAIITNADAESLLSIPLAATIPAGSRMIYEVMIVDDLTDTNFMRFGANLDGQTGPSWIMADACGAATPMDLAVAFGLPNSFVMNIVGDEVLGVGDNALSKIAVYPNPASDVLNVSVPASLEVKGAILYDVLGKNTGIQLVNGTMNTSSLARGIYMLNVNTSAGTFTKKVVKQ